jgi:hypothetical protein
LRRHEKGGGKLCKWTGKCGGQTLLVGWKEWGGKLSKLLFMAVSLHKKQGSPEITINFHESKIYFITLHQVLSSNH